MGLDITAYEKAERLRDIPEDWELDDDGEDILYVVEGFERQADGLTDGVYRVENGFGFRAGSYMGYNMWREKLAEMAGYTAQAAWNGGVSGEAPFYDLVNFPDNEGVIGPAVAAKLAKQFAEWDDRAKAFGQTLDDREWFYDRYSDWRKAFELAAGQGAVKFH